MASATAQASAAQQVITEGKKEMLSLQFFKKTNKEGRSQWQARLSKDHRFGYVLFVVHVKSAVFPQVDGEEFSVEGSWFWIGKYVAAVRLKKQQESPQAMPAPQLVKPVLGRPARETQVHMNVAIRPDEASTLFGERVVQAVVASGRKLTPEERRAAKKNRERRSLVETELHEAAYAGRR